MSYHWNNSNKNDLPTVTRTSSPASSAPSSPAPAQESIAPVSLPPPTSEPLSPMRYHPGGGEISSHRIMSHQADRIIPHGHSGKKKRGSPYSRCSSAEVNDYQQRNATYNEQHSGTTSVVQQKRSQSPLIQDMEMELDFLKGEWSTIDIILSSLRTACLRDGTDTFMNTNSFIPLAASSVSSFSSFSVSSLSAVSSTISTLEPAALSSSAAASPSSSSSSPQKQQLSQEKTEEEKKKDREKEMRVGYDELMLQVRQLEKKVDSLEYKIRQHYMNQHKKSRQ